MRARIGLVIMICSLCGMASGGESRNAPKPHLLFATSYHGDEMPIDVGKGWLALVCSKAECELRPAAVKTQRVHDDIVDEDAKSNTGVDVSTNVANSTFLVRDIGVESRAVQLAFQGEFSLGLSAKLKSLKLYKDEYILLPESPHRGEQEDFPVGYTLTLRQGNRDQVIFSLPEGGNDPHATLLWAGDLDGDGKLDLLVNASFHYNVAEFTLWLSSRAAPGQLVGKAAQLYTTGC